MKLLLTFIGAIPCHAFRQSFSWEKTGYLTWNKKRHWKSLIKNFVCSKSRLVWERLNLITKPTWHYSIQ